MDAYSAQNPAARPPFGPKMGGADANAPAWAIRVSRIAAGRGICAKLPTNPPAIWILVAFAEKRRLWRFVSGARVTMVSEMRPRA